MSNEPHNIYLDHGLFDIVVLGNHKTAKNGTQITIIRTTPVDKTITSDIKILDNDKKEIRSTVLIWGSEWSFIMPDSDVRIIPVIKRKHIM